MTDESYVHFVFHFVIIFIIFGIFNFIFDMQNIFFSNHTEATSDYAIDVHAKLITSNMRKIHNQWPVTVICRNTFI